MLASDSASDLQRGSTGAAVKSLQAQLAVVMSVPLDTDGIFGPVTEGVVKKFQANSGLPNTGRVDSMTYQAILSAYQQKVGGGVSTTATRPNVTPVIQAPKSIDWMTVGLVGLGLAVFMKYFSTPTSGGSGSMMVD